MDWSGNLIHLLSSEYSRRLRRSIHGLIRTRADVFHSLERSAEESDPEG